MLARAHKLKIRFQAYCENWKQQNKEDKPDDDDETNYNLWEDKLSPEEWDGVEEVIRVLSPFKKLTKQIECREKSLQDFVPYCDKILSHLYNCCQRFKRQAKANNQSDYAEVFQWLYVCAESAWDKANEYYKKVDDSPAYYTARVVDPRFKFEWFEQRWGPDRDKRKWLQGLKEVVNDYWQKYRSRYLQQDSNSTSQQAQQQAQQLNLSDDEDNDDSLDMEQYVKMPYSSKPTRKVDAFAEYTSSAPEEQFELSQWQLIEQKHPDLVQFALDHAAIPISISDCERSFSSAKFSLNPFRTRMKSDLFEALETLRAWYLEDQERRQKAENKQMEQVEQQVIAEALGHEANV